MRKIKLGIITDIHGNIIALEEILKDAEERGVDEYIFLGDLVNDFPFQNEVLDLIKKKSDKVLKGNKEEYLIQYDIDRYMWKELQFRVVRYMYDDISKENLEYIRWLPITFAEEYEGVNIRFAHGSPDSVEEFLHQNNRESLDYHTKNISEDVLIFGHTHDKMWYETINGKLTINAGCAGVSPYYVGGAEYVILDIKDGKINDIDLRVVSYDLDKLKEKIEQSGILEVEKTLMNLSFMGINGHGKERSEFFKEAKNMMLERNGKWYKKDANGIFKYFKLFDDDIWISLSKKYSEYFVFR